MEIKKLDLYSLFELISKCNNKKRYVVNLVCNSNDEFIISSTTKTKLIFEFMFNPEYITIGSNVIINDQSLKAFGQVTRIFK